MIYRCEPMNERARAQGATGFSLLELIAVLAVIALGLALVVPRLPGASGAMRMKADARTIHALFEEAGEQALAERRSVAVTLDLAAKTIALGADKKSLDPQTAIRVTAAFSPDIGETRARVVFFPDGLTSGARVDLSRNAQTISIEANWLTGHVRTFRDLPK
jgi:general secretion pathway protein H